MANAEYKFDFELMKAAPQFTLAGQLWEYFVVICETGWDYASHLWSASTYKSTYNPLGIATSPWLHCTCGSLSVWNQSTLGPFNQGKGNVLPFRSVQHVGRNILIDYWTWLGPLCMQHSQWWAWPGMEGTLTHCSLTKTANIVLVKCYSQFGWKATFYIICFKYQWRVHLTIISVFDQVMAWCQTGLKPLNISTNDDPVPRHIQWIKKTSLREVLRLAWLCSVQNWAKTDGLLQTRGFHWLTKCAQMTHILIMWHPKIKVGVIFLSIFISLKWPLFSNMYS